MPVTIIDASGPMATISRDHAYTLEMKGDIAVTGNPSVFRYLTPAEKALAREVALANARKAHPNDIATEADFLPGGRFDTFVAEIKEF